MHADSNEEFLEVSKKPFDPMAADPCEWALWWARWMKLQLLRDGVRRALGLPVPARFSIEAQL